MTVGWIARRLVMGTRGYLAFLLSQSNRKRRHRPVLSLRNLLRI